MIEKILRLPYQRFFVDRLSKKIETHISPTQLTIMGCFIGILAAFALCYQHRYLATSLLLISGYIDTLDGTVARNLQQATPLGAVLDIISDRTVEFAIVFGLFLINPGERSVLCMLMLGSILLCVTSFLVVGIFTPTDTEKSFYYSPGIMERAEAFIFFISMMLFTAHFQLLAVSFIILVMLTTVIRIYEFSNESFILPLDFDSN